MQVSIWEKETFFAPQDVIIVGSGFVGLWSAFYLKKNNPRLKITILDQGFIPTGASTRNAGFACFGSLSEVVSDGKTLGTDRMLELVEMRYKGLERIQKHFKDAMIDFELCGGYELYSHQDKTTTAELSYNIDYINSLFKTFTGTKKTYRLIDDSISTFGFGNTKHLVKNNLEGVLHSGKLLTALLHRVQGMGVQVMTSVEVTSIESNSNGVMVHTNQLHEFQTSKLLLCTNAFTRMLLPELDVVPARGQVILTSPIKGLNWSGAFHSDEGYYYFRNLGERVLLGGARNLALENETTTVMETSNFIQQQLEHYLERVVLPEHKNAYTIEHRWAGIMAMGSEKMPLVKNLGDNLFCAVRMSGMGVALAPVVGQEVAKMMMD
jgi:glycine/D-amino acid oxidase-like deaminating enzyme